MSARRVLGQAQHLAEGRLRVVVAVRVALTYRQLDSVVAEWPQPTPPQQFNTALKTGKAIQSAEYPHSLPFIKTLSGDFAASGSGVVVVFADLREFVFGDQAFFLLPALGRIIWIDNCRISLVRIWSIHCTKCGL